MVLAVIVSIAATDVKTHAAYRFENLGAVAGQIPCDREKIDVGEVMPVKRTGERDEMQAPIARSQVEALDEEVVARPDGSVIRHHPGAGRVDAGCTGHPKIGRFHPTISRWFKWIILCVELQDPEFHAGQACRRDVAAGDQGAIAKQSDRRLRIGTPGGATLEKVAKSFGRTVPDHLLRFARQQQGKPAPVWWT